MGVQSSEVCWDMMYINFSKAVVAYPCCHTGEQNSESESLSLHFFVFLIYALISLQPWFLKVESSMLSHLNKSRWHSPLLCIYLFSRFVSP